MPDGTIPDLVTRSHGLHVRAVREHDREADFVASTDAIDSYDEVIDQASWRLDRFRANPVILYGHQSYELPIGQATRVDVINGQLECTIRFATEEANPQAEKVWQLVREKVLRAVSVGFRPNDGKYELRDGQEVFVLYGCDLREISVVAIPANPECLAKMKADAFERADPATQERVRSAAARRNHAAPNESSPSPTDAPVPVTTPTERSDAGVSTQEFEMNEKELREALDKAEKALVEERAIAKHAADTVAAFEAKVKTLETEKASLSKELEKASADRDAATERATTAEAAIAKTAAEEKSKAIELEVDALVGKKISADEKADFIVLRTNSPDLFRSMVEKRQDMKLLERVTSPDTKAAPGGAIATDPGPSLFAKV